MKLSKQYIRDIIKEELDSLYEQEPPADGEGQAAAKKGSALGAGGKMNTAMTVGIWSADVTMTMVTWMTMMQMVTRVVLTMGQEAGM